MNWDDLKIALAVAHAGSLARASTMLEMDQSTVSRRLTALEARLGASLFKRSKSGLRLTELGVRLIPIASEAGKCIDAFTEEASKSGDGPEGIVRLVSNAWILTHLTETVLPEFLNRHEGIVLRLISKDAPVRLHMDATISLWFEAPPKHGDKAELLGEVPFALYCRKGANPDNLNWVSFYDEEAPDRAPIRVWKRRVMDKESLRLTALDALQVASAIRAGIGKGYLPVCLGDRDVKLFKVPEDNGGFTRSLFLHSHPDTRQSLRVEAMTAYLQESFRRVFLP
jgi:DNA-binding transcriptional LysR family regulator